MKIPYRIRNLRSEIHMWLIRLGMRISHMFGCMTTIGELSAILIRADGSIVDYGIVGMRVVTDVGVAEMVDDWADGSGDISAFNYHDSGVGGTAENQTDTTLVTQAGPTTRATGTKSQPSANVIRSIGIIAYAGTLSITEHGLFNQAAQGGILWDRTLFSSIGVTSGDSIQFTYNCTMTAGG